MLKFDDSHASELKVYKIEAKPVNSGSVDYGFWLNYVCIRVLVEICFGFLLLKFEHVIVQV